MKFLVQKVIIVLVMVFFASCSIKTAKVVYSHESPVVDSEAVNIDSLGENVVFINLVHFGDLSEVERYDLTMAAHFQRSELNQMLKPYNVEFQFVDNQVYFNDEHDINISQVREVYHDKIQWLEEIFNSFDIEGAINVYSFGFDAGSGLAGFTPILRGGFQWYEEDSPIFDRVIVSHDGMLYNKTMIHEFFHFFHASKDVTLMNSEDFEKMGLDTNDKRCLNYMNYTCYTDQATDEQIFLFVNNLFTIRKYLLYGIRI